MKRHLRYCFNLIEIVLAMGVVGIGIAGVMSLMAPALSANRDTQGETVAVEAASKLKALLQLTSSGCTESNWAATMGNYGTSVTVSSGYNTLVDAGSTAFPSDAKVTAASNLKLGNLDLQLRNPDSDNCNFVYVDSTGDPLAYVRLYRMEAPMVKSHSQISDSANTTDVYRYVIEVTWPASASVSYNSPVRQFRRFSFEIAKPYL